MRRIFSYLSKSINRYKVSSGLVEPSKIRKREIFILDLKSAVFSLVICGGLFFTIAGSNSTEKWSQEREDDEWEEFKIRPIPQKNSSEIFAVETTNKIDTTYKCDSIKK